MKFLLGFVLASGIGLMGQQGATIGYGYKLPVRVSAAPGQLLTIFVSGVSKDLKIVRAPGGADLPISLGGISVGYFQLPTGSGDAPILEVHPFTTCNGPFHQVDCGGSAAITIQVPLNALPTCLGCGPYNIPLGSLIVAHDGTRSSQVEVLPMADQVHILTTCDPFMTIDDFAPYDVSGLPCPSIVAHADGSLVSVRNTAKAGEELVAYAVGLGQTNPPSVTGKLVTTSVPTQTIFSLDFNYRPNALATKPLPNAPQPIFAGLTPGYVGLYQINFVVPPVPSGTPACVETSALMPAPGQNFVQSNLTVSVGGLLSFDGARICVAVSTP